VKPVRLEQLLAIISRHTPVIEPDPSTEIQVESDN
jgi:hypothetical protein